jgi:hypothetical protein
MSKKIVRIKLSIINTPQVFKVIFSCPNKCINLIGHTNGRYFQSKFPSPVVPSKIAARVIKIPNIIVPLCPNFKFINW